MKPLTPMLRGNPLLLPALMLCLAFPCLAAQTKSKSPTGAALAPAKALPAQPEVTKSVFIIPATPQEGKDPFFPRSARLYGSVVVKTSGQSTAPLTVDLKLNGISGTVDHRLAIINNRTFEANEEGTVSTRSGRVPIRCLEIQPDSVRVLFNGQERTLRLRPGS
jgi:hypothetical protein